MISVSKKDLEGSRYRSKAKKEEPKAAPPKPLPQKQGQGADLLNAAAKVAEAHDGRLAEIVKEGFRDIKDVLDKPAPKEKKRNFLFTVNRNDDGFIESVTVTEK